MFNRFPKEFQFATPHQESLIDIDNNTGAIDIDVMQAQTIGQNMNMPGGMMMGAPIMNQNPIMEPERVKVVHKTFEHIVPHMCPVKTKIINHHVYKHTYQPCYSCCEENVCEQVQCGSCCNF